MDIVLLGAPGAGKGTQGDLLGQWLGLPCVSSGELFRAAIQGRTRLGLQAQAYIDRGELVPDEVTIGMIAERLAQPDCARGVILDGFPRTVPQAQALDALLTSLNRRVDIVPFIRVSRALLLARLAGRWTCRNCQAVYHQLYNPEKIKGTCDACGGPLYQRPDDTPEIQERRIEVYLAQTSPLIAYYREKGILVEVNGEQEIAAVQCELRRIVEGVAQARGKNISDD